MPQDKKKILYDTLSKEYDLGTFDEFVYKLRDPAKRKSLYDSVSPNYDLGDYPAFEQKLAIEPEPVFTPPEVDDDLRSRVFAQTLGKTITRPFGALAETVFPEPVAKFPVVEGVTKTLDLPTRTVVGGMSEGGAELERAVDAVKKGNYAEAGVRAPLAVVKGALGAAVGTTPQGLGFVAGQELISEASPEAGEVIEKGLTPISSLTKPEGIEKPIAELGDLAFQFLVFGFGHKAAARLRQRMAEGKRISPKEEKAVREAVQIAENPSLEPQVKEAIEKTSKELPSLEEVKKQTTSEEPPIILPQGMKNGIIKRLGGKDAETEFGKKASELTDAELIELAKKMPAEESATTQAAKRGAKLDLAGAYLKWDEYKKTEASAKTYQDAFKGQLLREEVEGFIAKQEGREHKAMFPKDIEAKLQELSGQKPKVAKEVELPKEVTVTDEQVEHFKKTIEKRKLERAPITKEERVKRLRDAGISEEVFKDSGISEAQLEKYIREERVLESDLKESALELLRQGDVGRKLILKTEGPIKLAEYEKMLGTEKSKVAKEVKRVVEKIESKPTSPAVLKEQKKTLLSELEKAEKVVKDAGEVDQATLIKKLKDAGFDVERTQIKTEIPDDGVFFSPIHNLPEAIRRVKSGFPTTLKTPEISVRHAQSEASKKLAEPFEERQRLEERIKNLEETVKKEPKLEKPKVEGADYEGEYGSYRVVEVPQKDIPSAHREVRKGQGYKVERYDPESKNWYADSYFYEELHGAPRFMTGGETPTSKSGLSFVQYAFEEQSELLKKSKFKLKKLQKKMEEEGLRLKKEGEKKSEKPKETKEFKGVADIPVSTEGGGKPVKASEIIENLSKRLGVPIRIKHFRIGQRLGIFKEKPEVVRLKEANDLGTTSHEVAHFINKKTGVSKNFSKELGKLDYEPKKARASEGFAEFIRHYLTMDDAATVAPSFHKFFESEFLPKNPKFAEILKDAKTSIDAWRKQGARERILSQIDFDGTKAKQSLGERFSEYWLKFKTGFDTDLAPLNHAVNEILKGEKIEPRLDPREIATAVAKTAPSKARSFVLDGAFDFQLNRVGKSLKDIVKPVTTEIGNAIAYGYARRAVDLHKRGINPGITEKDAKYVVEKYKSPKFDKFVEEVTEWNGHLLNYLVDAGGLSKEAASMIREANPVYIPLKRAFAEPTLGTGRGKVDLPQPIKRIKGSGREIINPLESMISQAEKMIAVADKARVVRALVELAESEEGAGKWVEKVTAPTTVDRIGLERLKTELEKQGLEILSEGEKLKPEDLDAVITLFSQSNRYYGKDNVAAVLRNGKYEFYEFEPNLFNSLKGLDQVTLPWFINATFGRVSRGIRLGATGIRAGFSLITNPIRDAQTFALQTETGAGVPTRVLRGLLHEFRRTEERRQFRAGGGEMAQPLGVDRKMVQDLVEEVLANDKKSKALNVLRHPIEAVRKVLSFPEAGPRLAEFEAVMKKWEPQIQEALRAGDAKGVAELKENAAVEASAKAAEVTVNFKRMGTYGAVLNQIIPFFNPAVQGLTKTGRTLVQHPVRSGLRATAMLTAPTLALWWVNKDEEWYKELPDWQRYGFWNFKVGDEIYRLPKPFEWGYLFAGLPEATANSIYQKDPQHLKDWAGETFEVATPPLVPGAVAPAAEAYFNWDMFRERPIVPKTTEGLLPSEQYSTHTSQVAKEIGEIFDISPAKVDHLLSGYTGGLATDFLNALPKETKESADIPVLGRLFTRRDAYTLGGKSVQKFYEDAEKAGRYKSTINRYLKVSGERIPSQAQVERAVELLNLDEDAIRYYSMAPRYADVAKKLTALRQKQKTVNSMDVDEGVKKMLNEAIGKAAVELAKSIE